MDERLSQKEKELIAIGASVAAGCVPCTQYHARVVRRAGASDAEIAGAVDAALRVRAEARGVMAQVASEALGMPAQAEAPQPAVPGERVAQLVTLAAAVAANCPALFERLAAACRAAGVTEPEIRLAVGLAQMTRAKATEKTDEAARALAPAAAPAPAAGGCGCGS